MCPFKWKNENFLQANLYEKVRFLPFSSKNCKIQQCLWFSAFPNFRKMGEFAASIERSKAKSVSATPTRGSASRPRWPLYPAGGSAPDPHYRLTLCALAMPPLCQILNTPLCINGCINIRQNLYTSPLRHAVSGQKWVARPKNNTVSEK